MDTRGCNDPPASLDFEDHSPFNFQTIFKLEYVSNELKTQFSIVKIFFSELC